MLRVPHRTGEVELEGETAVKAAALIMPHINDTGASQKNVQDALAQLRDSLDTEHYFTRTAQWLQSNHKNQTLSEAPAAITIALEMASHEDQERRALEGELAELEAMWREAEEIAGIADGLLIPAFVSDIIRRAR